MKVSSFIDATYLKTSNETGITEAETNQIIENLTREAIQNNYKLVMVRPDKVRQVLEIINNEKSKILVGTVIDFPLGNKTITEKCEEALTAIRNGANDLDFVINYEAFKKGAVNLIKEEVLTCTKLALSHNKVIKWIIETAALDVKQMIQITTLIKNVVLTNFKETNFQNIFIKTSTGYYKTQNNKPSGATIENLTILLENGSPLPIKASGGIKSKDFVAQILKMGIKRIGTSVPKEVL